MAQTGLEHVNITVSDPDRTATMLCDLFGWRIRWRGDAKDGGRSIHVGSATDYIAVYSQGPVAGAQDSYATRGGLNHIGLLVADVDAVEDRVRAAGYAPYSHADYEPGRRFYFRDEDGIEFEVLSYAAA